MKRLITIITLAVISCALSGIGSVEVAAQTSMAITNQLPPYLLSAVLTNNGHFAISTEYTGEPKTLIYREDGTGNRPVNYTSHLHIKVNDVVFQMPYEINPTTDQPPPQNAFKIRRLFRDTVMGRPRINADIIAIMPGTTDTIAVIFTMEPVKRPSGGFIRMTSTVTNISARVYDVGVFMLIDTKIGDNDRAPIATAFGFSGVETEYTKTNAPGMPEFWLAFEGTAIAPGLAARGNLRASDLVEPDVFLFGNWVDDPTNAIPGLYRVLWDERVPSGLGYTDSAILLLWNQLQYTPGQRRKAAATEIGLVDSLSVSFGSGGGGGGGGGGGSFGVAGGSGCVTIEAAVEDTCGKLGYRPYDPDTLQTLYLVTNTGNNDVSNVRIEVGATPPGITATLIRNDVIPTALSVDATGVGVVEWVVVPRLFDQSYRIPVCFIGNTSDTIVTREACINVPGILAQIIARDATTPPICPGTSDTISIPIELKGVRCRNVDTAMIITPGAPATILQPLPTLPADGTGFLRVAASPTVQGSFDVLIRIVVRDEEVLAMGDTTWVDIVDTLTLTIEAKPSEVEPILPADTLDLGVICLGDTVPDQILIQNIGGCAAQITSAVFVDDAAGTFAVSTSTTFPFSIERGERGTFGVDGRGLAVGTFVGRVVVQTPALPRSFEVPVRLVVDQPRYELERDTIDLDSVCLGEDIAAVMRVNNPSPCAVLIDTVEYIGPDSLTPSSTRKFGITGNGRVSLSVGAVPQVLGPFQSTVRFTSNSAGVKELVIRGVAVDRSLLSPASTAFPETRVGEQSVEVVSYENTGNAPVTVTNVGVVGTHATDFTIQIIGAPLPRTLSPNDVLTYNVTATPSDIENRIAVMTVTTSRPLCNGNDPIELSVRGVQPLLDVTRNIDPNGICVGSSLDTTIQVRNVGNAVLQINAVSFTEPWLSTSVALPILLDSGEVAEIDVNVAPDRIGEVESQCLLSIDGSWLTPTDTAIIIRTSGLLCGVIAADTMVSEVGSTARVRIQLSSSNGLTSEQMHDLIGTYGGNRELRVTFNDKLLQVNPTIGGALVGAVTNVSGADLRVVHTGAVAQSADLLWFDADVKLAIDSRSAIKLQLGQFLDGFYQLNVLPGLVLAEYCAKEERTVAVTATPLIAFTRNSIVHVHANKSGTCAVSVYTSDGRLIDEKTLYLGEGQTQPINVPAEAGAVLFVRITSSGNDAVFPVVR